MMDKILSVVSDTRHDAHEAPHTSTHRTSASNPGRALGKHWSRVVQVLVPGPSGCTGP